MGVLQRAPSAPFSSIDPEGPLEAAFLMRRTGVVIASWTRPDLVSEVVSVMAATMLGSIETMSEALGCPSPEHVAVETDACRLFATRVEPQALLVLIAPREVDRGVLQRCARQILGGLPKGGPDNGGRGNGRPPYAAGGNGSL